MAPMASCHSIPRLMLAEMTPLMRITTAPNATWAGLMKAGPSLISDVYDSKSMNDTCRAWSK